MCGIAGWVGVRGGGRDVLDAMLRALEHRGPDDTGRYLDGQAALGMTRLSIIDLVTGRQPMSSDDGAATLVFNGEIYNFRDLRVELQARGRRFVTRSDTEVLLRAWEEWGEACVDRLRGMFAFAVWDAGRRRLLLARDRVGKKPLYYWHRDGVLVFASEPKARLEADVPLGVFLRGGVDSSVIVACMRELNVGRVATFTIGFAADASHDERAYARAVARRFETEHHEEVLEPKAADLVAAVVRAFDEPFADSSAIPTLAVAEAAARQLKVALSGIGGDEVFGGYPRYLGVRLCEAWARVPRLLRAGPEALARRLLPDSPASRNRGDWARRFADGAARPMPERYVGWTRFFDAPALAALVTPALGHAFDGDVESAHRAAVAQCGHDDAVDGAWRIDLATYLPDDLLTMADRMTMARSLELRAPFCDHRLIELSLTMPPATKLAGGTMKALLKAAFADVLPAEVVRRRK